MPLLSRDDTGFGHEKENVAIGTNIRSDNDHDFTHRTETSTTIAETGVA